ncbi:hypothetical protein AMAG_19845 [Allomyces macrogynus ATCC 38327]|uniref:BEACH domain-containing protein n=1 Tax=Allomyces macrogynus (strain ATCC 38327) TaxID=578462 RepID=A0A0L0T019_ALLM3|nr:hypothetical protein AMAG_19845 [Allomyces macrogynus ATCC 38327]|eukprot:KNE68092.1 hypothetical protein AMAG_19845 [Allomyces macrogynus ATCC 38327]
MISLANQLDSLQLGATNLRAAGNGRDVLDHLPSPQDRAVGAFCAAIFQDKRITKQLFASSAGPFNGSTSSLASASTRAATLKSKDAATAAVDPDTVADEIRNIASFFAAMDRRERSSRTSPATPVSGGARRRIQTTIEELPMASLDRPQVFDLTPIALHVYTYEQAKVDLIISKSGTLSGRGAAQPSLREYLDELEGLDLDVEPKEVPEDLYRPSILDVFEVPTMACDASGHVQLARRRNKEITDLFRHTHLRRPCAMLHLLNHVLVAYPLLPRLNDLLAFAPHKANSFQLQFVAYQLEVLRKHFVRMGAHWVTPDYRDVYVTDRWWMECQLPMVGLRTVANGSQLSPVFHGADDAAPSSPFRAWAQGELSNYDYLLYLNRLAGRTWNDPHFHPIMPWTTDFSMHSHLDGWRDLAKTKFRMVKGDEQLDMTFQNDPPHHVTTFLTDLSYYTYKARQSPKAVLVRHVRGKWAPNEYPTSLEQLYQWTTDECIPEFYASPDLVRSLHEDMGDMALPRWANSPEEFVIKHREVLESPHVSAHLHTWVDLMFGYRLTGAAAVDAKNVALPLSHPTSAFVSPYHGIRQLFRHPHPRKMVLARPGNDSASVRLMQAAAAPDVTLEDYERVAAFDALYFAAPAPRLDPALPAPVHPSLPHLYAAVLASKQGQLAVWPSVSLCTEAYEIMLNHALPLCSVAELMDRTWLKMEQHAFVAFFAPRIVQAPMAVPVALIRKFIGVSGFLSDVWPTYSRFCLENWEAGSIAPHLVDVCGFLGPAHVRDKVLPLLSLVIKKASLADVFVQIARRFAFECTECLLLPHLFKELVTTFQEATFHRVAEAYRAVFAYATTAMDEHETAKAVADVVLATKGRQRPMLFGVALKLVEDLCRTAEMRDLEQLILPPMEQVCDEAVRNPTRPLSRDDLLAMAFQVVRFIVGTDAMATKYTWAADAERRVQQWRTQAMEDGSGREYPGSPLTRASRSLTFMVQEIPTSRARSTTVPASSSASTLSARSTTSSIKSIRAWNTYFEHMKPRFPEIKNARLWSASAHPSMQCLAAFPDYQMVVTGGRDKTVKIWNLETAMTNQDARQIQVHPPYTAHQEPVTEVTALGHLVASCDGSIHVWDLETVQPLCQVRAPWNLGLVQSWPAARLLVGRAANGTIFVDDIRTRANPIFFHMGAGFSGAITSTAVSTKHRIVAAGSAAGSVGLLDMHVGSLLACWRAHDSPVTKLLFVEDLLVSIAQGDPMLYVWNTATFVLERAIKVTGIAEPVHLTAISSTRVLLLDGHGHMAHVHLNSDQVRVTPRAKDTVIKGGIVGVGYLHDGGAARVVIGAGDGALHCVY